MKYVKVEFPNYSKFETHERINECYVCRTYGEESTTVLMVPEDLYNEIMMKLEFPKKYENTNLGTIICYENYALVNGKDYYWYDQSDVKTGDTALIYDYDTDQWLVTTITAYSKGFPMLFEDSNKVDGINCEFIGYERK